MTELRSLTIARGIAAWLVVLYHIRGGIAGLPAPAALVLSKGYLAVDFFFLLSGFVIWLSWHERLRESGVAGIPRFLLKRVARIWPLHVAMIAAAAALALLLIATGRSDPAFPFAELPPHLLLVQNWGFTRALAWNDPAWSISCEFAAYLIFPLIAIRIDWRRLPFIALLATAIALLLALHWTMRDEPTLGTDIPRFGLARCLFEFSVGTILAAIWQRGRSIWPPIAAAVLTIAWFAGAPETLVVPGALAAILLTLPPPCEAAPRRGARGWWENTLHHLGEISYATYLSHFLLWKVFKLALVEDPVAVPLPMVALYLALVLTASALLYRLVERPAQRWINTLPLTQSPPLPPRQPPRPARRGSPR